MKFENYLSAEIRKLQSKDWIEHVITNYAGEISRSVKNTKIYAKDFSTGEVRPRYDYTHVEFPRLTTDQAIFDTMDKHKDEKVTILNFASFKNPGGGFIVGAKAQEEDLCRVSTLYPVLENFRDDFYKKNLKELNHGLYTSRLMYHPDILFFNGSKQYSVDVITCAAPNQHAVKKSSGKITPMDINHALIDRIYHLLLAAYDNHAETLILGAFGCGAFGNNVMSVAYIFSIVLNEVFPNCFKRIIFAIPVFSKNDNTSLVFYNVMNRHISAFEGKDEFKTKFVDVLSKKKEYIESSMEAYTIREMIATYLYENQICSEKVLDHNFIKNDLIL